jgi:hypothetical protein
MTQNQKNTNRSQNRLQEMKPRCLKAGQASSYIGCSRRTLTDMSKQGRIPYYKLSSRLTTYDIADLDRFLGENKIGGEV